MDISTLNRASPRTHALMANACAVSFAFPDGTGAMMLTRFGQSKRLFKAFASNLRQSKTVDDAIVATLEAKSLFEGVSDTAYDGLLDIMETLRSTAVEGRPDPRVQVRFS